MNEIASLAQDAPLLALIALESWWYGREVRPPPQPHDARALLDWFAASKMARSHQNHWESGLLDGERLVIYVENQGICHWATDPSRSDGPVWRRDDGDTRWIEESPRLDWFLLQAALFEACMGAKAVAAGWPSSSEAARLRTSLTPLPLPAWTWPTGQNKVFMGSESILSMYDVGTDEYEVMIGAKTNPALAALQELAPDANWSWRP